MIRFGRVFGLLAALVMLPSTASAEEYPFFVQPMTVKDVRVLAEELDLSREQSLALLGQYEDYNLAFGELQETEVRKVMDHAMDLVMQFQFWGGNAEMQIPPRDEITGIVDETLRAIRGFGRIDEEFFDSIVPLLSDVQLARLEHERHRRALARLELLHGNIMGEINSGGAPDLFGIMRRVEIDGETEALVDEILGDHAKRSLAAMRKFERAGREVIEKLLDEIDRLGLRDMQMMEMVAVFADEVKQQELKELFNVLSQPMQEASAALSRENLKALRAMLEVLPAEARRDVRRRFIKSGYFQVGEGVFEARNNLVRLLELHADQPEAVELQDGINALDTSFDSLALNYMQALATQRKLRSFAQLEGAEPLEAMDQVDNFDRRREQVVERATAVLAPFMQAKIDAEAEKANKSGSSGDSGETMSRASAIAKSGSAPLNADQVQQFGRWLGADAAAIDLMVVLHGDYEDKANTLLETQGRAIAAVRKDPDLKYVARRTIRREKAAEASKAVDELEAALFEDLALALPESIERSRISRIRAALQRSRRRHLLTQDQWAMRQQGEATIDLAAMILATDPSSIDPTQRTAVLDALISYDEAVVALVDELADRIEASRSLESRMWGQDSKDLDPEVRRAIRKRWQERRSEVTETANQLAQLNRSMAEEIFDTLPEEAGGTLRDAYERAAYPEIFGTDRVVDLAVEEVLAGELTPEQRQKVESRADSYRQEWHTLARSMVDAKRAAGSGRMFPPTRPAMESQLLIQRLRYRRAQLDERTMVQIELMLDPAQAAVIAAFVDGSEEEQ